MEDPLMDKELTQKQIDRQDEVDNAIFALVSSLVPASAVLKNGELEWDIDWIAEIREIAEGVIARELGIPQYKETWDKYSMEFYPYIILEEEGQVCTK